GLPFAAAQVVELGPADGPLALHLDPIDDWGMQREDALDPDPAGDLAHREGLTRSASAAGNHHAGEDLDAFLLPRPDPDVDANGVSRGEGGDARLERWFFDFQKRVGHSRLSLRKTRNYSRSAGFQATPRKNL